MFDPAEALLAAALAGSVGRVTCTVSGVAGARCVEIVAEAGAVVVGPVSCATFDTEPRNAGPFVVAAPALPNELVRPVIANRATAA